MFENLREDLRRYGEGPRQQARALLLVPGVWAIAGYRFARWTHTAEMSRPARRLMNVIATLSNVFVQVATNIEIPASAVIGPLKIGDDALIGVSAVVTRSVPPRGVAVGNPARVISLKGSFEVISYKGMETDPQRLNALREMTEDARLVV